MSLEFAPMHWIGQHRRAVLITAAAAAATGIAVGGHWLWRQRLPAEVRTLQAVLERLNHGDNLGREPLAFMVGSGSYTAHLAQQRGLCKEDACDAFAQLNPYRRYGNGWDELIRQGYAMGDIQAWSTSSGTVVVPRATFRAYGSHLGYLACTVAHEIAHIRRHHIFKSSYQEHHNFQGLEKKPKELALMRLSRQQELEADRDAATMLERAGYPKRICEQELAFMHRSVGDGSKTEPESTHPGYEDRLAALRRHYDSLQKRPIKPAPGGMARFSYNANDNMLTVTPQKP